MDRKRDGKTLVGGIVQKKMYFYVMAGLILWGLFVCLGAAFLAEREGALRWQQTEELSVIYPQLKEPLHENSAYYEAGSRKGIRMAALCLYFGGIAAAGVGYGVLLHERKRKEEETRQFLNELAEQSDQLLRGGDLPGRIDGEEAFADEWKAYLGKFRQTCHYFSDLRQRLGREENDTKSLITDISHQLKTPLASLRLSHELLVAGDLTQAEYQEFLEKEGQEITAFENLMQELVNLSRLENNMIQIKPENTKLKQVLTEAVNKVFFKANEKQIAILLTDEGHTDRQGADREQVGAFDAAIFSDPAWTAEAFANVLENAVKYSGENTTITITVGRLINYVYVDIEDEGIGIQPQELNAIYKRFYRGERAQKMVKDGVGVGLYLARKVLEEQGGNIVARRRRRGSCFRITLPCGH